MCLKRYQKECCYNNLQKKQNNHIKALEQMPKLIVLIQKYSFDLVYPVKSFHKNPYTTYAIDRDPDHEREEIRV